MSTAVDECLITAPPLLSPGDAGGRNPDRGRRVRGSAVRGASTGGATGRGKKLNRQPLLTRLPRAPRSDPANREPRAREQCYFPRMSKDSTRRDFLRVAGGATACLAHGATLPLIGRRRRGAGGAAGDGPGRADGRVVRPADALGTADPGRERSGPLRSAVLARLLQAAARRRGDVERRRHRRVLPDRGAAAPSQRLAGLERSLRHDGQRLPRSRHARRGADRPARGARRGAAGASGLDRGESRWPAGAALGQPGVVGHVRARPLQLRVHGSGASRDRRALPD